MCGAMLGLALSSIVLLFFFTMRKLKVSHLWVLSQAFSVRFLFDRLNQFLNLHRASSGRKFLTILHNLTRRLSAVRGLHAIRYISFHTVCDFSGNRHLNPLQFSQVIFISEHLCSVTTPSNIKFLQVDTRQELDWYCMYLRGQLLYVLESKRLTWNFL